MVVNLRLNECVRMTTKIVLHGKKSMAQWSEESRKSGNVTFTSCNLDNQPFHLMFEDVKIPFEPSQFGGDGTEIRRSICFSGASDEMRKQLASMEESIGATSSSIKDEIIRCKINMDKVRCFDDNRKLIDAPKTWRGWNANVQVHIRGKWVTRQSSGLCIEVTDIQLIEAREAPCPF